MTDAERQHRCRERRATTIAKIGLGLLQAKKSGDWEAVAQLAASLLRL